MLTELASTQETGSIAIVALRMQATTEVIGWVRIARWTFASYALLTLRQLAYTAIEIEQYGVQGANAELATTAVR